MFITLWTDLIFSEMFNNVCACGSTLIPKQLDNSNCWEVQTVTQAQVFRLSPLAGYTRPLQSMDVDVAQALWFAASPSYEL